MEITEEKKKTLRTIAYITAFFIMGIVIGVYMTKHDLNACMVAFNSCYTDLQNATLFIR